jgi:hypothetical protein
MIGTRGRAVSASVVAILALIASGGCGGKVQNGVCAYDGHEYAVGATFPATDYCNNCTCGVDGMVGCTLIGCACDYEGEVFSPDNGCNTCTCGPRRSIPVCTKRTCVEAGPPSCTYNGSVYEGGETFPSIDGCNTCTCDGATGGVACTEVACIDAGRPACFINNATLVCPDSGPFDAAPPVLDGGPFDAAPPALDASSDAGGAAPACVTTLSSLNGAAGGAPAPKILFAFDDASNTGIDPGFAAFTDTNSTATPLTLNTVDGHPCAGSLTTTVTYAAFGPKTQVYYNYGSANAQDWTGYNTLLFWVKVVTSDPSTIAGVEPRVDSGGYAQQHFGAYLYGATLSDGGWHQGIILLPAGVAAYTASAVNGFQLELQTVLVSADGGAVAPPEATLLIDSIWLN